MAMDLGLSLGDVPAASTDLVLGIGVGQPRVVEPRRRIDVSSPLQLGLMLPDDGTRFLSPPPVIGSAPASRNGLDVNLGPPIILPVEDPELSTSSHSAGSSFAAAQPAHISDDDGAAAARKKLRLSKEQSAFLEESFKEQSTLNPKQKLALAKQLNLQPRQVEVWFQNRRARTKLKQTEVDCEYLKRCCETLTEENRRLHKELAELRALKSAAAAHPLYMGHPPPATTLSMCPSCERITSNSGAGGGGAKEGRPSSFAALFSAPAPSPAK